MPLGPPQMLLAVPAADGSLGLVVVDAENGVVTTMVVLAAVMTVALLTRRRRRARRTHHGVLTPFRVR